MFFIRKHVNKTANKSQAKVGETVTFSLNNGVIIEVSNSHDYIKDSNGHETWVVSGK